MKKRPSGLPLGICVAEVSDVERYGAVSHLPAGLLEALLPGPVTLILPRQANAPISPLLNPGLPSLGESHASCSTSCVCAGLSLSNDLSHVRGLMSPWWGVGLRSAQPAVPTEGLLELCSSLACHAMPE